MARHLRHAVSQRGGSPAAIRPRLLTLAGNLHWTWEHEAQGVFAALDPALWEATNHNPIVTLQGTPPERLAALERDSAFLDRLARAETRRAAYLKLRPWFARSHKGRDARLLVAYFSSEFAIHESMPQYAGGLGVLAGDHIKTASDLGVPLVGVGLLYRCGYYQQQLAPDGSTRVMYPQYRFEQQWPVENTGRRIRVAIGGRTVHARIWKLSIGRTALYLLDADFDANRPAERRLTHHLYGADAEYKMRQQALLGIGGNRALEALGIRPTVYHLNEGHAAFVTLDRLRQLRRAGRSFDAALAQIRRSTAFTTHTPVPAGHDRFEPKRLLRILADAVKEAGLEPEPFLALGRENPADRKEPFCMTLLALRSSDHCNGVSRLHGKVSRRMWQGAYGAKRLSDVPIGSVTNGIHTQTWLAPEIGPLYERYLKPRWDAAGPEMNFWRNSDRIPADALWAIRRQLRARLVHFIRGRLAQQILARSGPVDALLAAYESFDEDALTIGFARRFATYKRAPLIFQDARRLAAILGDAKRPVQLVFSGKAHPADLGGQAFAQRVYRQAQSAGLRGRVVLLENYDMHIGRLLTSGCDVWLNNPIRPMEASGTSGMKPPLHGGINCSILDGWWPEAYNRRNGWAIGDGRELKSQAAQDRYDAGCIYDLLEQHIVPAFYARGRDGIPQRWVKLMRASMKTVCGPFSAHRMLGEYVRDYYLPAHRGT